MSRIVQHFINGRHYTGRSKNNHDVFDPARGEACCQVNFATQNEVTEAISAAHKAFPAWAATTPIARSRIIFRFKQLLEEHMDEIAALVTREHGKTLDDARGSITRAIELCEFSCGIPNLLKGTYSENVGTDIDSYTVHQPLGVCAGISPFNFPVMVPVWEFVCAIACGNTFLLKPSEKDPSAPLRMAELFKEAGLPDGVLNVVNGDKHAVDVLLTHPDVVAVTAVASTPVAEYVYNTAIRNGKRAHAFGGAKNHCLVMPDADMEQTVEAILGAAYGAAGERCMALSVAVTVGDEVADALAARLKHRVPELKVGPGSDPGMEMGPLVTAEHLQKVRGYIELGVVEGADLVVDGRDLSVAGHETGFFLGGSLFDHVKKEMRIYQEEIFGPVFCIVRQPDFDSALALINEHQFGNGAAIFTLDGGAARTFSQRVQAGMVGINIPIPVPVVHHPFGGWKRSVFGDVNMHGNQSIQFYTKLKTVTARWPKGVRTSTQYAMPNHR